MSGTRLGWHFLPEDRRLAHGDGREVRLGEWIRHAGTLAPCVSGLHDSVRLFDALRYAPGPIACRVETRGEFLVDDDKRCNRERRVLWWVDAYDALLRFARKEALEVAHLWSAPSVVVDHLRTGDPQTAEEALDACFKAGENVSMGYKREFGLNSAESVIRAAANRAYSSAWTLHYAAVTAREAAYYATVELCYSDYVAKYEARQNRRLTAMVSALPDREVWSGD